MHPSLQCVLGKRIKFHELKTQPLHTYIHKGKVKRKSYTRLMLWLTPPSRLVRTIHKGLPPSCIFKPTGSHTGVRVRHTDTRGSRHTRGTCHTHTGGVSQTHGVHVTHGVRVTHTQGGVSLSRGTCHTHGVRVTHTGYVYGHTHTTHTHTQERVVTHTPTQGCGYTQEGVVYEFHTDPPSYCKLTHANLHMQSHTGGCSLRIPNNAHRPTQLRKNYTV